MENSKSFIARMSDYFGRLPGQTTGDFGAELKKLTPKDKEDLVAWFNAAGLPTLPASQPIQS
jgi:hypothetical protein